MSGPGGWQVLLLWDRVGYPPSSCLRSWRAHRPPTPPWGESERSQQRWAGVTWRRRYDPASTPAGHIDLAGRLLADDGVGPAVGHRGPFTCEWPGDRQWRTRRRALQRVLRADRERGWGGQPPATAL